MVEDDSFDGQGLAARSPWVLWEAGIGAKRSERLVGQNERGGGCGLQAGRL